MYRTFAVCRPYTTRFRKRVFSFLSQLDYEIAPAGMLSAGTPDNTAALWVAKQDVDLILLPFHLHRGADGTPLDGVGVALLLPERFDHERSPILMPVSKYSWEASYHRRISILKEERPSLAKRIISLQEHEVGASHIARALGARGAGRKLPMSSKPRLRNFPTASAMSGSYNAVVSGERNQPSAPRASQQEHAGAHSKTTTDDLPSASWRARDPRESSSWRTQSTDRPVSSGARSTGDYESERALLTARQGRRK